MSTARRHFGHDNHSGAAKYSMPNLYQACQALTTSDAQVQAGPLRQGRTAGHALVQNVRRGHDETGGRRACGLTAPSGLDQARALPLCVRGQLSGAGPDPGQQPLLRSFPVDMTRCTSTPSSPCHRPSRVTGKAVGRQAAIGADRDLLAADRRQREAERWKGHLIVGGSHPLEVDGVPTRLSEAHLGLPRDRDPLEPLHLSTQGSKPEEQAEREPQDRCHHCRPSRKRTRRPRSSSTSTGCGPAG